MNISHITAHEILDSKGHPTVEAEVTLEDGTKALGAVPSGASTGTTEAVELRDQDKARYSGKGVLQAVENVNTILNALLVGVDAYDQQKVDQMMIDADGTNNKATIGGNAIVGVSMAICRAAARSQNQELYQYVGQLAHNTVFTLPQPMILIMEGGKHGDWATDIQEFMIIPQREHFSSFREMLRVGSEVFHALGSVLQKKGYDTGVGFEGAYAPKQLQSNQEALELIAQGIQAAGYNLGTQIKLSIDAAASEFFSDGSYILKSEQNRTLSAQAWTDDIVRWAKKYHIWSLEDVHDQEDWDAWQHLVQLVGETHQIVGDDLVTTNVERITLAVERKAMNATLIKVNQIGTVSETLAAIKTTTDAGFANVISHRGGETNDDFIADLAVGTNAGQCKFGGPDRGERLAKYNRLLRIENILKKNC